jgi:uncharacterized Ntn-hydrolase superfamily protein
MMVSILILFTCLSQGTFSIVAMDPQTNEWGIAVASKVFDVGYIVPWCEAGVGAVATQAWANPYIGPWVLAALRDGKSAAEALKIILEKDSLAEDRQIGIVDRAGTSIAYTGQNCLDWAGHTTAPYVSIQGNILTGPDVIDSMLAVFQRTDGPLAERLLSALEAGERAGGDSRGKQSAAIMVLRKQGGYDGVDDRLVDLKVVDNPDPVKELRRQYEMWQYTFLAPAYIRLADDDKNSEEILFERAHALLVKALKSTIESPDVYNNLAWEFALRKMYPQETLEAAHKAHTLAPDDQNIMDTVAEAYYATGDFENAILWERKALKIDPENGFYKKQLKKFEEALQSD